jgi:hypothetical protein
LLSQYLNQAPAETRLLRLQAYHEGQAEALRKKIRPDVLVRNFPAPITKAAIENRLKVVLVSGVGAGSREGPASVVPGSDPKFDSKAELASWKLLGADTGVNETLRRQQIHEMLATKTVTRPDQLTKWLYKEVLHADLADPYLGLGDVLFANYPFKDNAQ